MRDVTGFDLAMAMRREAPIEEAPDPLAIERDPASLAPDDADAFDLSLPDLPEALGETPEVEGDAGAEDGARPGGRIGRWTTGEEGSP